MIVIKQHKYGNFHTKSVTCFGGRKSLITRDYGERRRREGDSNPRSRSSRDTRFPGGPVKPLLHLSGVAAQITKYF